MNNQHLTDLKRRSDSKSSDQNRNNSQNLAPPSDSKVNRPHQYYREKSGCNFIDTEQDEKFEGFSIYTKDTYKTKHKQPSYTDKTYETNKRPNYNNNNNNNNENTQLRGYKNANNHNKLHLPQNYNPQVKKPLVKCNPPQIDVGQIDFMNLNSIAPNQYPVTVHNYDQSQQPMQNYTQQPQYNNYVQQYYAQQEQNYQQQGIQKKKLKKTAEVFQGQC